MSEQQGQSYPPVASTERADSTHSDTVDRNVKTVPASIEIDLGIEPAAYRYESWSEIAEGWVESLRSTAKTMPDLDHDQIRNVTPLVPLSDVEALVERMVVSGEVVIPDERSTTTRDASSP